MLMLHLCMQEVFRAVLYAELDFSRPPWDTVSAECRQLVQNLLQRDPVLRPTAAEALKHRCTLPCLTGLDLPVMFITIGQCILFTYNVDM